MEIMRIVLKCPKDLQSSSSDPSVLQYPLSRYSAVAVFVETSGQQPSTARRLVSIALIIHSCLQNLNLRYALNQKVTTNFDIIRT
jgi:hypothetical protein